MHHLYHTEGFVLGSQPFAEANKFFFVFTRELGMVGATAQSIRSLSSKLRYSLQDFDCLHISLVRGREWRVTNAREHELGILFSARPEFRLFRARIFSLLKRLL